MIARCVQFQLICIMTVFIAVGSGMIPTAFAQTVTEETPQTARDWVIRARGHQADGEFEAALVALDAALALITDTADSAAQSGFLYNERSVVLLQNGDPQAAIEAATLAITDLQSVSQSSVLLAAAHLNHGLAMRAANDLIGARDAFDQSNAMSRALGDQPLARKSDLAAASAELDLGFYTRAETRLEALLAEGDLPEHIRTRAAMSLANAFLARRQPADAIAALNQVPADTPGLWILEATLAVQNGKANAARSQLQSILDSDPSSADMAYALYALAEIAFQSGRYPEADELNTKAFLAALPAFGEGSTLAAQTLHRRALILQQIGDLDGALIAFDDAETALQDRLGEQHPLTWQSQLEKSRTLTRLGRHEDAIVAVRDVLDGDTFQSNDLGATTVLARAALGFALKGAGDTAGALQAFETVEAARAVSAFSQVDAPPGLVALAELYLETGQTDRAQKAASQALSLLTQFGFDNSIDLAGNARKILAQISAAAGDLEKAQGLVDQNIATIQTRLAELSRVHSYASDFTPLELRAQVEQALELGQAHGNPARLFEIAQLVHLNEVAKATNGFLRSLETTEPAVRDILDALDDAQDQMALLTQAAPTGSAETLTQITQLRKQITTLTDQLAQAAPALYERLTPQPVALDRIQSVLSPSEAVWLHMAGENGSYVFLVRSDRVEMRRTALDANRLNEQVTALRETVDQSEDATLVPFDFAAATALFQGLLGPFANDLASLKTLILVPDGAATQLSFAALNTADARTETGNFLGLSHALMVAPSLASFIDLRARGDDGRKGGDFVGFGDPEFSSDAGNGNTRNTSSFDGITRASDIGQAFGALPETRRELEAMSRLVPDNQRHLFYGEMASETQVKALDGDPIGTLVFATHAVVSGDFNFLKEPALVLTAPSEFTDQDDGLLTASEIAQLRLDAELVILSACNTGAASGRFGASGLSGLARGFFDAGAKTLVVSHWTINSVSSVAIMPPFYRAISGEAPEAPAEALQDAMRYVAIDLARDTGNPRFAHPAIWAPFMVVGGQ